MLQQHDLAVAADPPDAAIAAHHGDPYAEQRSLVARAAGRKPAPVER